jgi:hypothetical protein
MDDLSELIGSLQLMGVDPDGVEHRFVVGVGRPQVQPAGEWACPTLCHDDDKPRSIPGLDSLQALCLGLSFIRRRLEEFLEKGGRLFLPDGRDEVSHQDLATWFSMVGRHEPADR